MTAMSSNHNDGGQAYPGEQGHTPDGNWNQTFDPGMSLRDYFAAAALTGLLAGRGDEDIRSDDWSCAAYVYADAMLTAREESNE